MQIHTRKFENDTNSQNVNFFTLKNQTLIDNIFKYNLNFKKMNVD